LRTHHSIPSLASVIGTNEAKLKKLFHQRTGMGLFITFGPFHYLANLKFQQTKQLNTRSRLHVTSPATKEYSKVLLFFIEAFIKRFGISPGQYQN
jgi:AraC-like DNA-binding protein